MAAGVKARGMRAWLAIAVVGLLGVVAAVPGSAAGATEAECLEAGLARPAVLTSPTMRRAGIRPLTPHLWHSQGLGGWFELAELPESCASTTVRAVGSKVQMQSARNRRIWVNIGSRGGNLNWKDPGHIFAVQNAPNHAWPDFMFNECVGGKGWLKVRVILMPKVKDSQTGQLLDEARYVYPVKVSGSCARARYSKKVTANYEEEWGDGSGSYRGLADDAPTP